MIECIEKTGKELNLNNQGIVKYLCGIEEERKNLELIIQKQYQERKRIESEIERLTYKLCLINKSLAMRIKAKNNYDKTIDEIKAHYECLVASSNKLRQVVEKTQQELDDIMNKKTGTNSGLEGEEIKMLYVKPGGDLDPNDCVCSYHPEVPTKEYLGGIEPGSSKTIEVLSSEPPTVLSKPENKHPSENSESQEQPDNKKEWKPVSVSETYVEENNNEVQEEGNVSVAEAHSILTSSNVVSNPIVQRTSSTKAESITQRPKNLSTNERSSINMEIIAEETSNRTFSNLEKSGLLSNQASNRSKNMLLDRLRPGTSKPTESRVSERMSTIIRNKEERNKYIKTDHKLSDEFENKLLKRSLKDVLQVESSRDLM